MGGKMHLLSAQKAKISDLVLFVELGIPLFERVINRTRLYIYLVDN